ncbi:UDP-2,4-diacetamido-2,4,6-trideoxy-beta-L-altropyranose hydrolase [Virgibacillus flavescens]|uniref:UDP-2,4-diacetamido-2,4, 6-trideoxy-beta-L-altropyranose hydrolase n=1 Tax=Virgibacillus flavescens TaxID=1611422 RepID=UPI003D34C289
MNVCFRVDASNEIGSGHIMRCLTIADSLKNRGDQVTFICRNHIGHLSELIKEKGYDVLKLVNVRDNTQSIESEFFHTNWLGTSEDEDLSETVQELKKQHLKFDWIVIDHYAIGKTWHKKIRKFIPNIMVIDDLADREHDCDILLDQNYFQNQYERYTNLVPNDCKQLIGPKYSLLRDEFSELHDVEKSGNTPKTAIIFYGGSDPTNETIKAINAVNKFDIHVHVVVGPSNFLKDEIKNLCKDKNINFHYNINYMAQLMQKADFAICAGGSTTWERYCVGTPAILTAVAYNQIELCENVGKLGIDYYLGTHDTIREEDIKQQVVSFLHMDANVGKKAKKIVDGKGKTRVLEWINTIRTNKSTNEG